MSRVLMVGSAEASSGGVASVIRQMKRMAVWQNFHCGWLGTQIQRNYLWKLWYAVRAAVCAPFIIYGYDVVHFHTVPDRPGLLIQLTEMLLSLLYRKKTVVHIHMGDQLKEHTHNTLFCWYLRHADAVVLLANRFVPLMVEAYGVPREKIHVIYNAQSAETVVVDDGEREKSIIMAGYFDDNKAPDVLMRAWQKLRTKYPGWRLTLMGNGDVAKYKTICSELGLDDCVSFPGYVTGAEREHIWRSASILCLCSHVEGFPMVVLEAWHYGVPVVTTPVGGLPDVIEEGRNCLTFDFDDFDALARQLERLIDDAALRKAMSRYGQQYVAEHFSSEAISKQWERLYNNIQ